MRRLFALSTSARVGNLDQISSWLAQVRIGENIQFGGREHVLKVQFAIERPKSSNRVLRQFALTHLIEHISEFYNTLAFIPSPNRAKPTWILLSKNMMQADGMLNTSIPRSSLKSKL
jgi:hypothetical protein